MRYLVLILSLLFAAPAWAEDLSAEMLERMRAADVVWLGEVHDNPGHHARQASAIAALNPRAVVWEMLTPTRAALVTAELIADPEKMGEVLHWTQSGWPDFAMYHPVFAAVPDVPVVGAAVPRSEARAAMEKGIVATFGEEASVFGLDRPLPGDEQAAREADQMAAHCDALPEHLLPLLVDVQRLRDASLARAVIDALEETDGPVVVITGNGHARTDRGAPVYLHAARPKVVSVSLGQSEDGRIDGSFDLIAHSPAAERPDPCEAFRDRSQSD